MLSAHRISNSNSKDSITPGVKLQSTEACNKVLKTKTTLRETPYKDVFIHPDQSKEERLANSNLKTLVNAVNNGGSLTVRGNRVLNSFQRSRVSQSIGSDAPTASKGNNVPNNRSNYYEAANSGANA